MKTKFTMLAFFVSLLFGQSMHALTYTAEVPEGTPHCYITGDFNGWGAFLEMDRIEGTNTFTLEIPSATEEDKIEFYSGPGWGFKAANSEGVGVSFYGSGPHTVVAWLELYNPEAVLLFTVHVPEGTASCYISGVFNSWGFTEMERLGSANTFTIELTGVSESDEVAFSSGPTWDNESVDEDGTPVSFEGIGPHTVVNWKDLYVNIKSDKVVLGNVLGLNNQIVGSHVFGEVSIYSVDGYKVHTLVANGEFTSKYLERGIYIVRNNGVATKVLVN